MVVISFVSKDNEGNQNLLVKDRQEAEGIFVELSDMPLNNCGSWLACDSGVSGDIMMNVRPLSQASQLPQE
ncbi:MAG: hypothetical protein A2W79_16590 [Pseudomonadales bacterium RIFCSPLOWO2_12_60_38]|nr:hypothetical protein PD374_27765 [Pseudomonas sp. WCS374]AOS76514.1 hypothetical protein BH711_22020 [Pseudomonas fluorescens]EPJ90060.1 hypothetical protein CFT9_02063 [Pseudomonas sp. CFT9]ETK43726.1 hypothetical protein H098_00040 [Pseudomonas fluorescens FH5]KTC30544.1 hypothetical protein AO239_03760 [Pseudomonas sp. ICMP 19500]OHC30384.1 MAG: hypothetical protein A2W79_16590 [Pseudomonadales bacterium RIFCSPLOWO2_12_60_38]OHC41665.1 MAG: hypothetical protein A3G72_12720 [Pseudomonada